MCRERAGGLIEGAVGGRGEAGEGCGLGQVERGRRTREQLRARAWGVACVCVRASVDGCMCVSPFESKDRLCVWSGRERAVGGAFCRGGGGFFAAARRRLHCRGSPGGHGSTPIISFVPSTTRSPLYYPSDQRTRRSHAATSTRIWIYARVRGRALPRAPRRRRGQRSRPERQFSRKVGGGRACKHRPT